MVNVKPINTNTKEPDQGTVSSFAVQKEMENSLKVLPTVKHLQKVINRNNYKLN